MRVWWTFLSRRKEGRRYTCRQGHVNASVGTQKLGLCVCGNNVKLVKDGGSSATCLGVLKHSICLWYRQPQKGADDSPAPFFWGRFLSWIIIVNLAGGVQTQHGGLQRNLLEKKRARTHAEESLRNFCRIPTVGMCAD